MENNLFYYATSELSQDAFICYLLSFAMNKYETSDTALSACARELLGKMLNTDAQEGLTVTAIEHQHNNIDVLVTVNESIFIIIEDKTFTGQHGDQINRYKKVLLDQGIKERNIHCVYYKIVEQARPEPNVVNLTRTDLLSIFDRHKSANQIYNSYIEYLKYIDADVNAFKSKPIDKWRKDTNHAYKGFFTYLVTEGIIDFTEDAGWGYVSNQRGGFWGLWWYYHKPEELGLDARYIDSLYLQIEDNTIAVKLHVENSEDVEKTKSICSQMDFVNAEPDFKKSVIRKGRHMTVGRVEYDMKNYKEKLTNMQNAIDSLNF